MPLPMPLPMPQSEQPLPPSHRGVFSQLAERREGLLMGFADLGDELF